jgi:hypothetical protein
LGIALNVISRPRGCLRQAAEYGFDFGTCLQLGLELFFGEIPAPFQDDFLDLEAVGPADVSPALAELASVDDQNRVAPVPEEVKMWTSSLVPKTYFRPSFTSRNRAENSGVR